MNARVTLSPELLKAGNLGHKKKRKLREARVIEYITERPNLEPIGLETFRRILFFNSEPEAYGFIKSMVEAGKITKHDVEGSRTKGYSVPEKARTVVRGKVQYTVPEIEAKAKEFAWSSSSDSLREFIASLK